MGRTTTPKYVYEEKGYANCVSTPSAWKGHIPKVEALEHHVMAGVVSTMPGFANEAIGRTYGIAVPSYACIRENFPGGRVMVEWKAPMFQVLPNPIDYPEVAKSFKKKG